MVEIGAVEGVEVVVSCEGRWGSMDGREMVGVVRNDCHGLVYANAKHCYVR